MRVPQNRWHGARGQRRRKLLGCAVGIALLGALAVGPGGAMGADKQPPAWVKLPLRDLGFPGVSATFLSAGASMLTVHFLDDNHLLVTYATRGLVPRLKDDPAEHEDRMVAGEIVDLPSGKIMARTEWHMHDHARYLWPLGQGRFLLRIGDSIAMIAPLAHLAAGDPFERIAFPHGRFHPNNILVSPDQEVLTLETRVAVKKKEINLGDEPAPEPKQPTLIEFYRIKGGGNDGSPLQVAAAGAMLSPEALYLPIDADGALWATEFAQNKWDITFDGYEGKTLDPLKLESTCEPQLQMVSRSEFLAVSCRGSDDHTKLAAYGMDGHEAWEEPFGALSESTFVLAPQAARFAMSRPIDAVVGPPGGSSVGSPPRQEVRVYQIESGDLLLRVDSTPPIKTGENFDLAADGMVAAVVRDGAIAVYRLPELSKQDRADMALAAKAAPPVSEAAIRLPRITLPAVADTTASVVGAEKVAAVAESAVAKTAPAEAPLAGPAVKPIIAASATEEAPRKRPSLLNPGERAEFPEKSESPQ